MKILIIGSGAREHAMAHKFSKISQNEVHVWPGNSVTRQLFKVLDCPENANHETLAKHIRQENVDLTVVGPEAPLATGLADQLLADGLNVFGPVKKCAELEASKTFAKEMMFAAAIPTAKYETASSREECERIAKEMLHVLGSTVIKASGLAAGKGVFVCDSVSDIENAIHRLYDGSMKSAAESVVIEEKLIGRECSHFSMVRDNVAESIGFAVDFKRLKDNDIGPNTGGMGCYTPVPWLPDQADGEVREKVITPLLEEFSKRGLSYTGFLYTGLMWTESGPSVVEFNVRLGDPEAQVLCVNDERDWVSFLSGAAEKLPDTSSSKYTVGIVLASDGYPYDPPTSTPVTFDMKVLNESSPVFSASVGEASQQEFCTGKGRVLTITGTGEALESARSQAYSSLEKFAQAWPSCQFRTDIARKASDEA